MTSPKIAFIAQEPSDNNTTDQTTWALMQAAQNDGYEVYWMEPSDLHLHHNTPVGYMSPVEVQSVNPISFQAGDSFLAPLSRLDVVWWRQPGPYEFEQLFALDLLQALSGQVRVINHPSALRSFHPHLWVVQRPELFPRTLITKNSDAVKAFLAEVGGQATIQPLHQTYLQKSFLLQHNDPNSLPLVEALTQGGTSYVLLQQFIQEAGNRGEKRLFLLQGEVLGAATQTPASGELRGSFERNARPAVADLSPQDLQIAQQLSPMLREQGVFLATVDVADGKIIDINLSCPSGLTQLQEVANFDVLASILQAL